MYITTIVFFIKQNQRLVLTYEYVLTVIAFNSSPLDPFFNSGKDLIFLELIKLRCLK